MKRKMMKWTAALAVALTLAGGAAGLAPAQFSLPDFSVTAEAASKHYYLDTSMTPAIMKLSGTFTFDLDDLWDALPEGWTPNSITAMKLSTGANVTFTEPLQNDMSYLEDIDFTHATVNMINEDGEKISHLLSGLRYLKRASFNQTVYNGSWYGMFEGCTNLTTVDLEIRAGQKINDAEDLFKGCSSLTTIYWNNYFDTSEVKYMSSMFEGCSSLTEIDMTKFNLSSVKYIDYMFADCSSLTKLDLSGLPSGNINFQDSKCWEALFLRCYGLNRLDLPANFRLDRYMGLPYTDEPHLYCPSGWAFSDDLYTVVTNKIGLSGDYASWDNGNGIAEYKAAAPTTPVTFLRCFDWICDGDCFLVDLFNHVMDIYSDFNSYELRNLPDKANVTTINFARDNISLKGDCTGLFAGYSSLQKIDLSNVDMSGVTSTSRMFENCSRLTEFTASFSNSGKYPVNLTDMSYMFSGCKKMTSCGMYNWDLSKVSTFEGMFDGCKLLKYYEPYIQSQTANCTNVKYMFRNCSAMTHLNLGSWNLENVPLNNKADMFAGCSSLRWLTAYSRFGVISANMKLRNDNGGWGDNTTHTADGKISGSGSYAVISAGFGPYFHMSEFGYVINIGVNVDDYPVPGKKITNNIRASYNGYTIVNSASGWYDASGNKLEKNAVFQMEGAYYLKLTLNPTIATGFREITPDVLKKIRIGFKSGNSYYDYDTKKQFVDVRAGKLNSDGTIELYCVVDSGAGNPQISDTSPNTLKTANLPGDVVYKNDDTYSAQGKIPCFRLPSIRYKSEPLLIELITQLTSSAYQDYLGYGRIEYYVSVDGGEKQSIMKNVISGLQPNTAYRLSFVNSSGERFGLRNWSTNALNKPVAGSYLLNSDDVKKLDIAFSAHTVALNNNLGAVYYVPASALEGYENIKLYVRKEIFDQNGAVSYTTEAITNYTVKNEGYGDEYLFSYNNVAAREMASNLYAAIYAEKDGEVYVGKIDRYSVVDYAIGKLNKTSTPPALAALCADLLNYGAAAQTYFSYHTDFLANSTMTAAHQALATNPNTLKLKSDEKVTPLNGTAKAYFSGKTLELGNNVSIVFMMQFDDSVDLNTVSLKLSYQTITGQTVNETIPFKEFTKRSGEYQGKPEYQYSYNRVYAKDSSQPVTATILINGKPASDSLTYSVQSYAKKKLDNANTPANVKTIIRALMVYCKSAEKFFKS